MADGHVSYVISVQALIASSSFATIALREEQVLIVQECFLQGYTSILVACTQH
jgi:hypothetical protein